MKLKNLVFTSLLAFVCMVMVNSAWAQPQESKKDMKKSSQPEWVQDEKYGSDVKNVYFPEQDMYYNVKKEVYIYKENGKWTESKKVPSKFEKVDLEKTKKVELSKNTKKPQKQNEEHKAEQRDNKTSKQKSDSKGQSAPKK